MYGLFSKLCIKHGNGIRPRKAFSGMTPGMNENGKQSTLQFDCFQDSTRTKEVESVAKQDSAHWKNATKFRFWREKPMHWWSKSDYRHRAKRRCNLCNLRRIPFFVLLISALQTISYYAADDKLKRILVFDTESKKEFWRFLTYMLLHTDDVHLGLNMLIQGLLGIPLELEQGRFRCAAIYFGGGLAGSLAASAFASLSLLAGASGGVYALLTSQIPNVVLNYETIKYAAYRIVTVALLTASDVIYIFCHVHFNNNERPQIGWVAHASGAAAGLLLGFLFFKGTSQWKKKLQVTSWALLVFSSLLLLGSLLAPSTFKLLT